MINLHESFISCKKVLLFCVFALFELDNRNCNLIWLQLNCGVQIASYVLHFRDRARSKCGTFDYFDHIPAGGDKKV